MYVQKSFSLAPNSKSLVLKNKKSGFNDNYLVISYDLYNYMIYIIIINPLHKSHFSVIIKLL